MTTKPRSLSQGDTVALISPANALPDRFKKQEEYSISYLQKMGYKVKNYINHTDANNPFVRANTLMDAYNDKDVKALFPICGGEKVHEILDLIDYDFISANPKIICGYSFIGPLLLSISERAKSTTFFGPHMNFINDRSTNRELLYTVAAFWNILSWSDVEKTGLSNYERTCLPKRTPDQRLELTNIYKNPQKIKQSRQDISYTTLNDTDTDEAIVYAQSLDSLMLMGNYNIPLNLNGKLLLLDTLDDSFDYIKYKMNILNDKYPLNNVSGIIFASFNERTDKPQKELDLQNNQQIMNFLKTMSDSLHTDKLYYGFPMGHCKYKLTIPIGIKAKFDYKSGSLIYSESPFDHQR